MKKRFLFLLFICAFLLCLTACDFEPKNPTEGVLYEISEDGTHARVVGYEGNSKRVKVADTYEGLPVRVIGEEAFYNTIVKYVYLPEGITAIEKSAFEWCALLKNIQIPSTVKVIGEAAFLSCERLTSVTIPDSVTSIGDKAFRGCIKLTSVILGNGVTTIGDNAFCRLCCKDCRLWTYILYCFQRLRCLKGFCKRKTLHLQYLRRYHQKKSKQAFRTNRMLHFQCL